MYKVATNNLSEDFRTAEASIGPRHLGTLAPSEVRDILEYLRAIDPVQNHEAEPNVTITTATGKFVVRTSAGRLFLYDLANPAGGSTELTSNEIIEQLGSAPLPDISRIEPSEIIAARRRKRGQQWIALAMLAVGLLLNGYTVYSAFYTDDVNYAPGLTLITDPAELTRTRDTLLGTFATGSYSGDRGIVVRPDGTIRLLLYGDNGALRQERTSPFVIGRRDKKVYIGLKPHGQIEVLGRDLLSLYGDTYHRVD